MHDILGNSRRSGRDLAPAARASEAIVTERIQVSKALSEVLFQPVNDLREESVMKNRTDILQALAHRVLCPTGLGRHYTFMQYSCA